jgi:TolB-like protein/protein involved in temperature-dependent protein secretion
VYAAAVLLHELVTGELPWGASTDPAAQAGVVPASRDKRGAPPGLAELLQRGLAADPAERPQDAAAWRLGVEEVQRALLAARAGPVSVAVLPVVDLGAGAGEHLADALTELLIAQLARDRLLRVISRSTAMAYRGSSRSIPRIGRELSVGSVVEGSILRMGGELQLVVKLVEAASDRPIWSDRLGFTPEAALAVVERAAAEIGRELHARVGGVEVGRGEGARAVAPRALDAHVRGQYHLGKRTAQALATALVEFQAALEADPGFVAPHVGAAHAHIMSGIYGFEPPRVAFGQAREHALRALALDPRSGEATGALASVHLFHDYDLPAALELARRAAELNPSYAVTHLVLGDVLLVYERFDEALEQLELAIRLDPLDRGMRMNVGDFLSWAGDQRAAARQLRGVLELDPHHLPSHVRLARVLALLGDRPAALEELAIVAAGAGRALTLETTALCQAALGDAPAARAAVEELERLARAGRASAMAAANGRAALRDRDAALEWLERALEERSPMLPLMHLFPPTRAFRDDPGFAALGRRIGIPRFAATAADLTP